MVKTELGIGAIHIEFAAYSPNEYALKSIIVRKTETLIVNKNNNSTSIIISVCNSTIWLLISIFIGYTNVNNRMVVSINKIENGT